MKKLGPVLMLTAKIQFIIGVLHLALLTLFGSFSTTSLVFIFGCGFIQSGLYLYLIGVLVACISGNPQETEEPVQ